MRQCFKSSFRLCFLLFGSMTVSHLYAVEEISTKPLSASQLRKLIQEKPSDPEQAAEGVSLQAAAQASLPVAIYTASVKIDASTREPVFLSMREKHSMNGERIGNMWNPNANTWWQYSIRYTDPSQYSVLYRAGQNDEGDDFVAIRGQLEQVPDIFGNWINFMRIDSVVACNRNSDCADARAAVSAQVFLQGAEVEAQSVAKSNDEEPQEFTSGNPVANALAVLTYQRKWGTSNDWIKCTIPEQGVQQVVWPTSCVASKMTKYLDYFPLLSEELSNDLYKVLRAQRSMAPSDVSLRFDEYGTKNLWMSSNLQDSTLLYCRTQEFEEGQPERFGCFMGHVVTQQLPPNN